MSSQIFNTYPTTPEQLFLEQQARDHNNPGCIYERRFQANYHKNRPLSQEQKLKEEEASNKWKEDLIAGYASKRIDFPEYQWWMIQDGKQYLRSSKNFNVYDNTQPSVIIGTWNEETQRIEFMTK